LIYARSRRSIVRIGAAALALALVCGCAGAALLLLRAQPTWTALPAGLGAGGLGLAAWLAWRTKRWPDSRLCFFRDRILVVDRRKVTTILWSNLQVVTLASGGLRPWAGNWSDVKLGDRLTMQLEPRGRPMTLRPADFGLDPAACRDLILNLRDDFAERLRLPEFDSALDLRGRPATAGELNRPVP
jgi:hypothetical protein